jgi:predicted DNA-binding protein (MmcQ/YjbR family)
MNIEELREHCLKMPHVTEELPFGPDTLVFKIADSKIFLLTGLDGQDFAFNVKCDPELAIQLRELYPCVQPGYHMNKTHWNTINVDGSVNDEKLKEWINNSYQLVLDSLSKKVRTDLLNNN